MGSLVDHTLEFYPLLLRNSNIFFNSKTFLTCKTQKKRFKPARIHSSIVSRSHGRRKKSIVKDYCLLSSKEFDKTKPLTLSKGLKSHSYLTRRKQAPAKGRALGREGIRRPVSRTTPSRKWAIVHLSPHPPDLTSVIKEAC